MSSPSLHPAAMPCLVALDTATEVAHLALCLGGEVQVQALGGAAQASATTLPGLQAMLAQSGLGWPAVQAIAFGQGPGAFTGLRTACAIAQGLALGLNLPVIALDTLMAVAESARRQQPTIAQALASGRGPLWVLQDARMSEVYAAAYTWTDGTLQQVQAPALWPLSHWQAQIDAGCICLAAGSALLAYPAHTQSLRALGAWPWGSWPSRPGPVARRWTPPWHCPCMCATKWPRPPPSACPSAWLNAPSWAPEARHVAHASTCCHERAERPHP
jgi:tRNA threonylcarbamoyladenosine biosynthesis protein TsaB